MKKFLCVLLVVAMALSTLGMVSFAVDTATPAEPELGGAKIIATARTARNAAPSQDVKARVQAAGLGNYYLSAWVRLAEAPDKPVTVEYGIEVVGSSMAWPMTPAVVINDTEWHKLSGTISINDSNLTSLKSFAQVLYQGMQGARKPRLRPRRYGMGCLYTLPHQ